MEELPGIFLLHPSLLRGGLHLYTIYAKIPKPFPHPRCYIQRNDRKERKMKGLNNAVWRGIFAVLVGLALVLWPEVAVIYMIMVIGAGFLLPGIFSVVSYFLRKRDDELAPVFFPFDGLGSILLGLWLLFMPEFFVNILMYVLGAILVIAGLQQMVWLISARKWRTVGITFYILPSLILLTGILILVYPMGVIANTLMLFGIAILVYGANELVNWFKFRKYKYIQLD